MASAPIRTKTFKNIEPLNESSRNDNSSLNQSVFESTPVENRPCGPCVRPSNNKYFDCPPRMSDGRLFTDYRPRCDINYMTMEPGSVMDSYAYRQYLLNNGETIMQSMRDCAQSNAKCGPCVEPFDVGTMLPEQQIDVCNEKTCVRKQVQHVPPEGGLGIGRWYGPSFSSTAAPIPTTPKQRQSNKRNKYGDMVRSPETQEANCCETSQDTLNYFPSLEIQNVSSTVNRLSSPFGGVPLTGGDTSINRKPVSIFESQTE